MDDGLLARENAADVADNPVEDRVVGVEVASAVTPSLLANANTEPVDTPASAENSLLLSSEGHRTASHDLQRTTPTAKAVAPCGKIELLCDTEPGSQVIIKSSGQPDMEPAVQPDVESGKRPDLESDAPLDAWSGGQLDAESAEQPGAGSGAQNRSLSQGPSTASVQVVAMDTATLLTSRLESTVEPQVQANLDPTEGPVVSSVSKPASLSSLSESSSSSGTSSSSDSSLDSDTDDTSETEFDQVRRAMKDSEPDDAGETERESALLRSKNEQDEANLEIPAVSLVVTDEMVLVPVGRIKSILPRAVIVESTPGCLSASAPSNLFAARSDPVSEARALDADTVLCLSEVRVAFGRVFDTFGPVTSPFYLVRFSSDEDVSKHGGALAVGKEISFVAGYTQMIRAGDIRSRGYDSSNLHDEEIIGDCHEYSDDEAEAAARRVAKRRNGRGGSGGLRGTLSHQRPAKRHQHRGGSQMHSQIPNDASRPCAYPGTGLHPLEPQLGYNSNASRSRGRGLGGGRGRGGRGRGHQWGTSASFPDQQWGMVPHGASAGSNIQEVVQGPPLTRHGVPIPSIHPMMAFPHHGMHSPQDGQFVTAHGRSERYDGRTGYPQVYPSSPNIQQSMYAGNVQAPHMYPGTMVEQSSFMTGTASVPAMGTVPERDPRALQAMPYVHPQQQYLLHQHALQQQAMMMQNSARYQASASNRHPPGTRGDERESQSGSASSFPRGPGTHASQGSWHGRP